MKTIDEIRTLTLQARNAKRQEKDVAKTVRQIENGIELQAKSGEGVFICVLDYDDDQIITGIASRFLSLGFIVSAERVDIVSSRISISW